jgi:hypothetical protein
VKLDDILSYTRRIDEARMKVLAELAAEVQELDLGYLMLSNYVALYYLCGLCLW